MRIEVNDALSSLIQVRDVAKTYTRGSEQIHVLQGLNLDIEAGDYVAFMGPSGSGKTTLLNLLTGLAAAVLPALGAKRLSVIEALRRL
jgi:putative ABC transport system ATP-binding protein